MSEIYYKDILCVKMKLINTPADSASSDQPQVTGGGVINMDQYKMCNINAGHHNFNHIL